MVIGVASDGLPRNHFIVTSLGMKCQLLVEITVCMTQLRKKDFVYLQCISITELTINHFCYVLLKFMLSEQINYL